MRIIVLLCCVCAVAAASAHFFNAAARANNVGDGAAVLVGAGDIADCRDLSGAEATAKLLEKIPGTVMAGGRLGDPGRNACKFACFDKTWGGVKKRTGPAARQP